MTSTNNIKAFYDGLEEKWQKDIFAMKLETVLSTIDDNGFPEELATIIAEFALMDSDGQHALVKELKIKNQIREWEAAGIDLSEIINKQS